MKRELWYEVIVRDRQGKVVSRERRRSRSFLKQWNQLMYVQITGRSLPGVMRTSGVTFTLSEDTNNFRMDGAGSNYGIVCGTGDTAVAIDDYALAMLIEHGVGAGLFNYQAGTVSAVSIVGSHAKFVNSRTALNNSGGLITVKEVGIYTRAGPSTYVCGIRDVLETPQDVPDGGGITIDYTLEVVA